MIEATIPSSQHSGDIVLSRDGGGRLEMALTELTAVQIFLCMYAVPRTHSLRATKRQTRHLRETKLKIKKERLSETANVKMNAT